MAEQHDDPYAEFDAATYVRAYRRAIAQRVGHPTAVAHATAVARVADLAARVYLCARFAGCTEYDALAAARWDRH